jgi:hypothetical protein
VQQPIAERLEAMRQYNERVANDPQAKRTYEFLRDALGKKP